VGLRQVSWAALVALLACDGLKAAGEPALPDGGGATTDAATLDDGGALDSGADALAPVDAASENKRLVFVTAAQAIANSSATGARVDQDENANVTLGHRR